MARYDMALNGQRIHLAIEGSTGGTSLGLHAAADTIALGKRVLWASVEMPDAARFSQLLSHLSLVESSRFHAMNFGGKFERAIDALIEATQSLPSVGLVVMDDWCEASGRIDAQRLKHIGRFAEACPEDITLLLISKGTVDASGATNEPILARGEQPMKDNGFEIWRMWRNGEGPSRTLDRHGERQTLTIQDSGFVL